MPIVDSQIHLAPAGKGTWVDLPDDGLTIDQREAEAHSARRNPEFSDLLRIMDRAGVDAAILVPMGSFGSSVDNESCIAPAREYPERFAVMARIHEAMSPDEQLVRDLFDHPEVLGLRLSFHSRQEGGKGNIEYLSNEKLGWLWDLAEELNKPVMVFAPRLTAQVRSIAKAHPKLQLIYDHVGVDALELRDDLTEVIRPVLELADLENVSVKTTGLPANVTEGYPFPNLKKTLQEVFAAFGPSRVFWGSDIGRIPCRYEKWLHFFSDELDFLSQIELDEVLGLGIIRLLNWTRIERTHGSSAN